jgi:hypothetical protein
MDRLIINIILIPFKLASGMNGRAFAEQGILVHDSNDWTVLVLYNTSNSSNTNIIEMMIVNTLDINSTIGTEDNTDIVTSNTTISTMVNEGPAMGNKCLMLRDKILNMCTINTTSRGFGLTWRITPGVR